MQQEQPRRRSWDRRNLGRRMTRDSPTPAVGHTEHPRLSLHPLTTTAAHQIEHWFDGECPGRYRLETGVGVSQGEVEHALLTVDAHESARTSWRLRGRNER